MPEYQPLPVQWLEIEAGPARWDNYVETDGMLIYIAPKDDYGNVVPVRGTLDVDLIAEHAGVVRLPDPFSRIGHWSQAVRPEDFGPYGAVYRLPFQDVNPEFSNHLGPHGAIHAILKRARPRHFRGHRRRPHPSLQPDPRPPAANHRA